MTGHQERDHPVPCRNCHHQTMEHDALCSERCRDAWHNWRIIERPLTPAEQAAQR